MAHLLICFCDVLSVLWERWRYKTGGIQTSEAEAEVGGREDCVAVSLWLSWDLKLWSGSFWLGVMWLLSFLELADCREAITATILILICWNIHFNLHSVILCEQFDVPANSNNRNCVVSHTNKPQSLIVLPAAEPWRAWWMTWQMTHGTTKPRTGSVPFASWMTTRRRMTTREHSFGGPRLTPASWKQWRKRPRTCATTWTLPKAWTPTKTRSITPQTEWPRLCDLYLRNVFYLLCLAVSSCTTPQPLFFSFYLRTPVWPTPPPIQPWDACNLTPSPVLCKTCLTQSIGAAVPSSF